VISVFLIVEGQYLSFLLAALSHRQGISANASEIGSQDLHMLPNFAWVKWFNLAPVLYNSQEKVGLPCLILSMGAGLIGEFFKCNGVNALMWVGGDAQCHFLMS
jgi:hypothetical protein